MNDQQRKEQAAAECDALTEQLQNGEITEVEATKALLGILSGLKEPSPEDRFITNTGNFVHFLHDRFEFEPTKGQTTQLHELLAVWVSDGETPLGALMNAAWFLSYVFHAVVVEGGDLADVEFMSPLPVGITCEAHGDSEE